MRTASWFHMSVKTVGRSQGRSAVAAAAYRLGQSITDERTTLVHDYTRRGGVVDWFCAAPADAPDWHADPARLWNAAEHSERRRNSTVAREIELALPADVTSNARHGIAHDVAQALVERYGVGVTVAIHEPSRQGDQRNHHAHIMFTTRELSADGLGAKTRILDDRKTGPLEVEQLRELTASFINRALEEAGSDERVDHRSFEARGIDQEPTQHLGPSASEIERRGAVSDIAEENRAIEAANAKRDQFDDLVAELADLDASIERRLRDEYWPEDWFLDQRDEARAVAERDDWLVEFDSRGRGEDVAESAAQVDHFEQVRQETQALARDDVGPLYPADEPSEPGRFERARLWWQQAVETFTEWRGNLIDRYETWRSSYAGDQNEGYDGMVEEPNLQPSASQRTDLRDRGGDDHGYDPPSSDHDDGVPEP